MNQLSHSLPALLQPIARAAFWTAATAVGFFALFAPSIVTGAY